MIPLIIDPRRTLRRTSTRLAGGDIAVGELEPAHAWPREDLAQHDRVEAAWTRALDLDAHGGRDRFVRAVVGADARPRDDVVVTAGYYFNGWGVADPPIVGGVGRRNPR